MEQAIGELFARLGNESNRASEASARAADAAAARERARATEESIRAALRPIAICDGTVSDSLRIWLRELDAVHARDASIAVEVATRCASQALREAVEGYAAELAAEVPPTPRGDLRWPNLKTHVRTTLLGPGDQDIVRQQLSTSRQAAHEEVAQYAVRFTALAKDAYAPPRDPELEKIVAKYFVAGLQDPALRQELIIRRRPTTLRDTVEAAKEVRAAQLEEVMTQPKDAIAYAVAGPPIAAAAQSMAAPIAIAHPVAAAAPSTHRDDEISALNRKIDQDR